MPLTKPLISALTKALCGRPVTFAVLMAFKGDSLSLLREEHMDQAHYYYITLSEHFFLNFFFYSSMRTDI